MALSSIYSVDQWVQETKVASPPSSDRSDVPVDLPWVLYKNCLSLLSDLVPYVAAFYPSQSNEDLASFNDDLGCLCLWGEGLDYEQLNDVFLASEDLRNTSLEILASLADALTDQLFSRIAISTKIEDDISILQQILDIRKGAHDARRILHGAPSINREDLELPPNVMEDAEDVDADATTESIDEILEQIHCYVECLMNLLPSIERSLRQINSAERSHHGTAHGEFQVSRPAEIYVRNVRDRFASANSELTERLGEANWQRHQRIRSLVNAPEIPVEDVAPKSVFKPISEFQDSALGSSIPTRSSYAATMASHTSFASTFSEKESGTLRVPPTPGEVFQGIPFDCEICGKRLADIRSRIDWKLHVFEDLQPYICTFSECKDSLITFPTRKLWGDHEFTRHRVDKSWNCLQCSKSLKSPDEWENHCNSAHGTVFPESQLLLFLKIAEKHMPQRIDHQQCPLCLAFPGVSQRNFISHVGKHMESIALAALPHDEDSGSECGSTTSKHLNDTGSEYESSEIYMSDGNPISDKPEEIKGRGARRHIRVTHDDGLKEEQWLIAVDDDYDEDARVAEAAAHQAAPREAPKLKREVHFDGKQEDSAPGSRDSTGEPETAPENVLRRFVLIPKDPSYQADGETSHEKVKHPATFQCNLCPKRFTRAYNLRSHLRIHTDERPFVCTVCGECFARRRDQKRHEKLHSDEKKFVCKGDLRKGGQWGCGRRFTRHEALAQHLVSEAGRICMAPLRFQDAEQIQSLLSDSLMKSEQTDSSQEILKPEFLHTAGSRDCETADFSRWPPSLLLQYPQMHEYGPFNIPQPAQVTETKDGSTIETPSNSNNLM